ncbi:hypothetical protein ABK040_006882 [Willaertia magna]
MIPITFFDFLSWISIIYIVYRLFIYLFKTSQFSDKHLFDKKIESRMIKEYEEGIIPTLPKHKFIEIPSSSSFFNTYSCSKPLSIIDVFHNGNVTKGVEVEYIYLTNTNETFHFFEGEEPSLQDVQDIYYLIPGNPGSCLIYFEYMKLLSEKLKKKHPNRKFLLISVSLRGHSLYYPPSWSIHSKDETIEKYTLEDQIDYHTFIIQHLTKQWIKNNQNNNVKIHLMGHSVGCLIISKVMERLFTVTEESIQTCKEFKESILSDRKQFANFVLSKTLGRIYFYYPTVQFMSKTPNGSSYLKYIVKDGSRKVLTFLSTSILTKLIPPSILRWVRRSEPILVPIIPYYMASKRILTNLPYLANHEFKEIMDNFGVENKIETTYKRVMRWKRDEIFTIFSTADDWVPRVHLISFLEEVYDVVFVDGHRSSLIDKNKINDEEFCRQIVNILEESRCPKREFISDKTIASSPMDTSKDHLSNEIGMDTSKFHLNLSKQNRVTFDTKHAFVIHSKDVDIVSDFVITHIT